MYAHVRGPAAQECVMSASSGGGAIRLLLPEPAAPAKRKILRDIGAVFLRRRLWLGNLCQGFAGYSIPASLKYLHVTSEGAPRHERIYLKTIFVIF